MIEISSAVAMAILFSLMASALAWVYFICRITWVEINSYIEGWKDATDSFCKKGDSESYLDDFEECE